MAPKRQLGEDRMSLFQKLLARLSPAEGQTFVEYALILAVVVVGVLLAVTWAGDLTIANKGLCCGGGPNPLHRQRHEDHETQETSQRPTR